MCAGPHPLPLGQLLPSGMGEVGAWEAPSSALRALGRISGSGDSQQTLGAESIIGFVQAWLSREQASQGRVWSNLGEEALRKSHPKGAGRWCQSEACKGGRTGWTLPSGPSQAPRGTAHAAGTLLRMLLCPRMPVCGSRMAPGVIAGFPCNAPFTPSSDRALSRRPPAP